ncbi:hypothetical protein V7138_23160 [Bacillus sp. JJ1533]|uniref:hypothetical protein n=1 Tax=Bacillus sp. JJ1533 TaxID=3122959 RepID=UPI002FFF4A2F
MKNWMNLFNKGRRLNLFNMFNRRRNNRGILWASLLGLGVSAAVLGLRRNGNKDMMEPIRNVIKNGQMPSFITEFSKELVSNIKLNQEK